MYSWYLELSDSFCSEVGREGRDRTIENGVNILKHMMYIDVQLTHYFDQVSLAFKKKYAISESVFLIRIYLQEFVWLDLP